MAYRSDELAQLVQDDHTNQVVSLEEQTTADAIGTTDSRFEQLIRRSLAAWVAAYGSVTATAIPGDVLRRLTATVRAAVRRLLGDLAPRAATALEQVLAGALSLGVQQGVEFLHAASGMRRNTPRPRIGQALRDEAARITGLIGERRERALMLLRPSRITRWSDLIDGIGAARAAVPAVRAHVAWVVNTAINGGLQAVIHGVATLRLWVAEADACVRCLAYAGRIVPLNELFPGGLSWDPRQRHINAPGIDGPPLHAHCRCRAVPWSETWTAEGIPFPLALQREAHRSLAYGRARPTESRAARIRAARELLRTEPDLLPSVEATARRAVRTGRFPQAA